jgi:hypothetical protein
MHLFLFIFVMQFINYFYELHTASTKNILRNISNKECYQGSLEPSFNATGGINTIKKFTRSIFDTLNRGCWEKTLCDRFWNGNSRGG